MISSTSTVKTSMCTTYLSSYCIVLLYMCLVYSPLAAKYRISSFMTMSQALKVSKKKIKSRNCSCATIIITTAINICYMCRTRCRRTLSERMQRLYQGCPSMQLDWARR